MTSYKISLPVSLCFVLDALVILNSLAGVHGVLGLRCFQLLVLSGNTHHTQSLTISRNHSDISALHLSKQLDNQNEH